MNTTITPEQVELAAVKARKPLTTFIREAGVSPSAFYRWRAKRRQLRPLTLARLAEAIDEAYRARTAAAEKTLTTKETVK